MGYSLEVSRVLGRLENVRPNGEGWSASCPGPSHKRGDVRPSLSIGQGDDGRVLLNCHGGCPTESVLGSLGLSLKDLFPGQADSAETARTFLYCDRSGKLVRKKFHKKGWGSGPLVRTPYKLEELEKAQGKVDTLYLPEGEPDVETLEQLDLLASCAPNGGSGKVPSECLDAWARFPQVVILLDEDDVGRRHALCKLQELKSLGVENIKVLAPTKGICRKSGGTVGRDITDHIHAGGTMEDLQDCTETLQDLVRERVTGDTNLYPILRPSELGSLPMSTPLVEGLLDLGTYAWMYGDEGTGKSFLAVHLCCCLASQQEFFGRVIPQPRDCLYLMGEGSQGIERRFRAWTKQFGCHGAIEEHVRVSTPSIDLLNLVHVERLLDSCSAIGLSPNLIVVDTASRLLGKNVADPETPGLVARSLRRLQDATGATVLFIGHVGHNSDGRMKGQRQLSQDSDRTFRVIRRSNGTRCLQPQKSRDELDERPLLPFNLKVVSLSQDGTTSCVVETSGDPPIGSPVGKSELTENRQVVLRTLASKARSGKSVSPAEISRSTAISGSSVYSAVDWLVKNGYVERTNGRKQLTLTSKGEAHLRDV